MRLTDYGIHNERSDIRAHVCPVVKRVYVFPTASGIKAVTSGKYRRVDGFQSGVEARTASGFLVPPMQIEEVVRLAVRESAWAYIDIRKTDPLPAKGAKATKLVSGMIQRGLFPIPGVTYSNPELDIQGSDILFCADSVKRHIQVKCDYPGGEKNFGGTGHLYLQVAERNPKGLTEREQKISIP